MLLAQQGGWGGAELYWIIICLKLIMACQMIHACSLSMAVHVIYGMMVIYICLHIYCIFLIININLHSGSGTEGKQEKLLHKICFMLYKCLIIYWHT